MTAVFWIAAGIAAFVLVVVALAYRGPLAQWGEQPVILRKSHLLVLAVALTAPACSAMVVSLAGRVKLDGEIRKRIDYEADQAERARDSLRRILRLEAPTTADFLRILGRFDELCFTDRACADRFIRALNRNIQVAPSGVIVRARPGPPPALRPPQPRTPAPAPRSPQPAPRPVIPPAPRPLPPALPDPRIAEIVRDVAALRREIDRLRSHEQDSAILNGLDNRLTGLERALGGVRQTVDGVRAALCSPALSRLLTALGICR